MSDQTQIRKATIIGSVSAFWGVGGVGLLLGFAVYRLALITVDAFAFSFQWYHWLVLVGNIVFMAHSEGYRGFQKNFSPRVAARARYLKFNPNPLYIVLAPLFCMGYFHTTPRRLIGTYGLTLGIVLLIIVFDYISQPWRGILDAGVVVGLSWGVVSLGIYFVQAMTSTHFSFSAEVSSKSME